MTTEEDFQRALDAQSEDFQTRLVFADWLQERGDPRAEGYRALGANRRGMFLHPTSGQATWFPEPLCTHPRVLPGDWCALLQGGSPRYGDSGSVMWVDYGSRREAEDAAALAFLKLPAERRAELLAGESEARE